MLKKLLYFALFLCIIVITIGAYTRLSDAGLGCPDWPTCYGNLIVPNTTPDGYDRILNISKAWIEMTHRYVASLLGLIILIIWFYVYKNAERIKATLALPSALLLVVILQGLLGMWTVTHLVHPGIVSLHLAGGFLTATMLFWFILNQRNRQLFSQPIRKRHGYITILALVIVSAQIMLGAWVSTHYAALSCGNYFPTCLGQWLPTGVDFTNVFSWGDFGIDYEYGVLANEDRVAIQMLHRIGALVTLLIVLILVFLFWGYRALRVNLAWIILLLSTQIALGISNVIFSLPIATAVAHNVVALLLLLGIVGIYHKAVHSKQLEQWHILQ